MSNTDGPIVPGMRGRVDDLLDPPIVIVTDPPPVAAVPLMRFSFVRRMGVRHQCRTPGKLRLPLAECNLSTCSKRRAHGGGAMRAGYFVAGAVPPAGFVTGSAAASSGAGAPLIPSMQSDSILSRAYWLDRPVV